LDQPGRALDLAAEIQDWRRGTVFTSVAYYFAQHGAPKESQHCLDLAQEVVALAEQDSSDGHSGQVWRRDRIRIGIARTYLALGKPEEAAKFEDGVENAEAAKLRPAKSKQRAEDAFDDELNELESTFKAGDFDQVQGALEVCAQLFDQFYTDSDRRTHLEQAMKNGWAKLPLMVRIDLMTKLIGSALTHADKSKALTLLDETQTIIDGFTWNSEDQISLMARLAGLRFRAGGEQQARSALEAALALFNAQHDRIVDIYRAAALRAIAESYLSMGESNCAHDAYARAVEAGMANPNSRPRAEDLCATCCSMALHGLTPDAKLIERLRQITAELKAPW